MPAMSVPLALHGSLNLSAQAPSFPARLLLQLEPEEGENPGTGREDRKREKSHGSHLAEG